MKKLFFLILDVMSNGLVQGLNLGYTQVHAKAVGINPTTGQRVLYSQVKIQIHILQEAKRHLLGEPQFLVACSYCSKTNHFIFHVYHLLLINRDPASNHKTDY